MSSLRFPSSLDRLTPEIVTALPPSWLIFCTAYCATFPEPDTRQLFPSIESFTSRSIDSMK